MKYILLIFFSTFLSCNSNQNTKKDFITSELDSISYKADTYMSKLTELKRFNGVLLLKKEGEVILRKTYNISKDTSSTLFVSKKSQFDLRSVGKLFAKVSVLKLEKENKLNRKEPIENYIKDFPNGNKITIKHLMNNTSGLPRKFTKTNKNFIELTSEEVIALAKKEKLEFTPGTKEQYSNIGFQLLYYIIGKVNNNNFYDYLNDSYFMPLKMLKSGSNFYNTENKTTYAYGHYLDDKDIICECSFPDDEMRTGNLYSTVNDLDTFLAHLDTINHKDLIYKESISHSGGTRGKRAYVERNFIDDYTIIFLANYDAIPFEKLVKDLQSILRNKEVKMPKSINRKTSHVTTKILKKYEGTYDFVEAGHLIITLKLENDSLFVYQKGKNNGVLYPENETTFFGDKSSEESIKFIKNKDGEYNILMDFQGVQWKGIKIK